MSLSMRALLGLLACQTCWAVSNSMFANAISRVSKAISAGGSYERFRADLQSSSAFELLDEVEKMVEAGNADPDKIKIIKDLVLEQLIPALEATHKTGQDQVDARVRAIDECASNTKTRVDEIHNTTVQEVDKVRREHKICRETQGGSQQNQEKLCNFLNFLTKPADMPVEKSNRKAMLKYGKTMMGYWCNMGDDMAACKAALEGHSNSSKSCSLKQRQFEIDYCTLAIQIKEACEDMSSECYNTAKKAFDETVRDTKDLEKKWKTEYAAMKKIACFVDVWLGDENPNTVSADKFEKCKAHDIDTSPMNINYGTPAAQYQCKDEEPKDYPGTPGFITKEYKGFEDVVDEVVPCLAAMTPA